MQASIFLLEIITFAPWDAAWNAIDLPIPFDEPVIKNDLRPNSYFYPVNLTQEQTVNRTDGYIYAYIRYGGKVMMPAYARITPDETWDVVYYVRYLQGKVK